MNTLLPVLSHILKEMNNERHLSKTEQMCYVLAKFPEDQRRKVELYHNIIHYDHEHCNKDTIILTITSIIPRAGYVL